MYGLPGSLIQFGSKPAAKKRGRPSALSKFLENQRHFFPVDLFTAKLSGADRGAAGAGSAPLKAAQNTRAQQRAIKAKRLYVLVTRKVSLTDETKDTGEGS